MNRMITDAIRNGESKEHYDGKHTVHCFVRSGNAVVRIEKGPAGERWSERKICEICEGKPVFHGAPRIAAAKRAAAMASEFISGGFPRGQAIAKAIKNTEMFLAWGEVSVYL